MDGLPIFLGIIFFLLLIMVIIYFSLQKKIRQGGKAYEIQKMLSSTKSGGFSLEIFYQKAYNKIAKMPVLSRYLYKIRRRLEILSNNDEYVVRKQSIKIFIKIAIAAIFIASVLIIVNWPDPFMLILSAIGITVIIETLVDMFVNKLEDKLMKQTLTLFSEIRHYYHEYGMVDEAIYESAQIIDEEISIQGLAIYEILISNDPEIELEKYYDVAPNRYLKAFAGISYLTMEYGDRKVDQGSSLYLKNINNITQELQMEIMKRDKINYVFQSLSVISIAPLFVIKILKEWAMNTFAITSIFYESKIGKIAEIVILLLGFICYNTLKRTKESNDRVKDTGMSVNKWQEKVYNIPLVEWIVDRLMPQPGSYQESKEQQLLIDTNSPLKLEWVYVNRIVSAVMCFIAMMGLFAYLHSYEKKQIYTKPTEENLSFGASSEKELEEQYKTTDFDNYFINKYKDKKYTKEEMVTLVLESTDLTKRYTTKESAEKAAERIIEKMDTLKSEYVKPYEVIIAIGIGIFGYFIPMLMLKFNRKMRELEKENEVMQFQTLILMLMRIERMSVEMILEWLERFSNVFKPVISTCLNNFEAGGWKALDELKDKSTYPDFIRIVENLQAAVDKIPIVDAFDELESERAFFQEKRKEANERLITKKSMIGKIIGFAPMITLFVGYLIIPLIYVSMTFMGEYMAQMASYM